MAYWLYKSEPAAWSWDDQKKKGAKGEPWSGVRNHQANNNMKAMKKGDLGFFYHSVEGKEIVGIVRVIGEHRPDPTDETGKFGLVIIEAVEDMPKPVTLAAVKAEPRLAESMLMRMSRLSVQPVSDAEWKLICKMGGLAKAP